MIKQFIRDRLFPKSNNYTYLSILSVALFFLTIGGVRYFGIAQFKADPLLMLLIVVPVFLIIAMSSYVFNQSAPYDKEKAEVSQMVFSGFIWGAASIIPIKHNFNGLSGSAGGLYLILLIIAVLQFIKVIFLFTQTFLVGFIQDRYIWGQSRLRRLLDSLAKAYTGSFISDGVTWRNACIVVVLSFFICALSTVFLKDPSFQPLTSLVISSIVIDSYRKSAVSGTGTSKRTAVQ